MIFLCDLKGLATAPRPASLKISKGKELENDEVLNHKSSFHVFEADGLLLGRWTQTNRGSSWIHSPNLLHPLGEKEKAHLPAPHFISPSPRENSDSRGTMIPCRDLCHTNRKAGLNII